MDSDQNNLKFCEICGSIYNYLYENQQLYYNCRKCSNKKECTKTILDTNKFYKSKDEFNIRPNPNMINNNTLQRTKQIECPHCKKNNEIIYYKAFYYEMTLVYICSVCKNYWQH
jgi:DNA-directed RNA polymerase subunit M/transcription elongation factor TFIIS